MIISIIDCNSIEREGLKASLNDVFNLNYVGSRIDDIPLDTEFLLFLAENDFFINKRNIDFLSNSVNKDLKIVVMDRTPSLQRCVQAINLGIKGYLTTSFSLRTISLVFKSVAQDRLFIEPSVVSILLDRLTEYAEYLEGLTFGNPLTDEEAVVLDLMLEGQTAREIAPRFNKSRRAIDSMKREILVKTGAKDNMGLVFYRVFCSEERSLNRCTTLHVSKLNTAV
jgi:DNA-binding CsgD family transcriptional regulator